MHVHNVYSSIYIYTTHNYRRVPAFEWNRSYFTDFHRWKLTVWITINLSGTRMSALELLGELKRTLLIIVGIIINIIIVSVIVIIII